MNKIRVSMILLLFIYFFTGCKADENRATFTIPHLAVVFTHSGTPLSEVVRVGLDGSILEKKEIKGQGIFGVDVDDAGNLLLPATYNDRLFMIKTDGTVVEEKVDSTPMYVRTEDGVRIIPYNIRFDQNKLEIIENGNRSFVDIDATVFRGTWDNESIYVRGDQANLSTGGENAYLYVISRRDKRLVEKIILHDIVATQALEVIDQKVWIGSSYTEANGKHVLVFDPKTKSQTYVPLVDQDQNVPLQQTVSIFATGHRIHIVDKSGIITVLDRNSWDIIEQKQVQPRILGVSFDESRVYTLMQNPNDRNEAIITTYNLKDWSFVRQWRLTGNGKTLPQNLILVRNVGASSVSDEG